MSIKTRNGQKFSFVDTNGLSQTAPENSDIYCHLADNGTGKHEIHGKVRKPVIDGEFTAMQEIGWHRLYNEDGSIASLPSDTTNLLESATTLVIASLKKLNPTVEFIV